MMFFVYKRVLGPLNQCFDRLDQKKIKNAAYLSYLRIFISTESMFHARSTSNNISKQHFLCKAILGPLKSCFDQLDQEFLKN